MKLRSDHFIISLYILGIVSILSACKKSNNASPSVSDTQMSFALSASSNVSQVASSVNEGGLATNSLSISTNAATSANITWTAGTANISGFKLEAKKQGVEIEIKSRNLTNVDLLAITLANISTVIDTGTYREIEIKVLLTKSSTSTIPLTLKGNYTSTTGTVTPIELDFNDDAIIKVEAENITVDGKTDLAALAKLDLTKLIGGAVASALDAATRTNGVIVISSTVNANLYNVIKARVELCGSWGGFGHHGKGDRR
jgi:hypothetical protein